jgi:hypothetical protein
MATLTRDPTVNLADFHDVRLGRMLDAIWAAGPALALLGFAWVCSFPVMA